jgi:hypothetical protein
MIEWTEVNNSVLDMAQEIIREYHPNLVDAKIGFVFRSEASASKGRTVFATAMKADKKIQPFLIEQLDFLIWIARDQWEAMGTRQREALLDHELCHCQYNGIDYSIRGHDFEEFGEIIKRRGLWNSALMAVGPAFHKATQMEFDMDTHATLEYRGKVVALPPLPIE